MGLTRWNLIDLFTLYLTVAFVTGTVLRFRNYKAVVSLIASFPQRYPRLLVLAKQHRAIFLRWPTLLPVGCTAALMVTNATASHFFWSEANVTLRDLGRHWLACLAIVPTGVAMIVLDFRAVFLVGQFDRAALEADLDRAEHWLGSWKAPALRVLTLGLVNPRRIVGEQVRGAIVQANIAVNGQMWRWALQTAVRLAFGLALWVTWTVML